MWLVFCPIGCRATRAPRRSCSVKLWCMSGSPPRPRSRPISKVSVGSMIWSTRRVAAASTMSRSSTATSGAPRAGQWRDRVSIAWWLSAGEVRAVFCFDASRLARNGGAWHHLLELCGLAGARVIDIHGIYDPCRPNDRLLLGMKGSISEFELGVLRARISTRRAPRRGARVADQRARRLRLVGLAPNLWRAFSSLRGLPLELNRADEVERRMAGGRDCSSRRCNVRLRRSLRSGSGRRCARRVRPLLVIEGTVLAAAVRVVNEAGGWTPHGDGPLSSDAKCNTPRRFDNRQGCSGP